MVSANFSVGAPANIVLIMCNQMHWDAAGVAGRPIVQPPHLHRLAESGVCFENANSSVQVRSPAWTSWLTGLYPHAHLQMKNYSRERRSQFGGYLPQERVTIGDILKKRWISLCYGWALTYG